MIIRLVLVAYDDERCRVIVIETDMVDAACCRERALWRFLDVSTQGSPILIVMSLASERCLQGFVSPELFHWALIRDHMPPGLGMTIDDAGSSANDSLTLILLRHEAIIASLQVRAFLSSV